MVIEVIATLKETDMLTLTITATTSTDAIEAAIPFLDMRREAIERRDDAAAVLPEQGDQTVLELHEIDGVTVLHSPAFEYAYVNEAGPGVGDSLLIENWECPTPDHAARVWRGEVELGE